MKYFRSASRLWVPFLVAALVLSVFYLYLYVYVPQNERELTASKFRTLSTLSQNLKMARENSLQRFRYSLNTLSTKLLPHYINDEWDSIKRKLHGYDSLEADEGREVWLSSTEQQMTRISSNLDSVHINIPTNESKEAAILRSILDEYHRAVKKPKRIELYTQSISIHAFLAAEEITLEKNFEEFVIVRVAHGKRAASEAVPKPGKNASAVRTIAGISYQTFSNELRIKNIDSLFMKDVIFYSGKVSEIKLKDENYKLFAHRMAFDANEDWILCGLSRSSTLNRQAHRVDIFIGLFAAFLLLAIILLMPVLKLLIMSAIERLQIINVLSAGLSIAVAGAVLCLLIMFGGHTLGGLKSRDKHLSDLAQKINSSFEQELNTIIRQLESFKNHQSLLFKRLPNVKEERFSGLLIDTSYPDATSRYLKMKTWSSPDLSSLANISSMPYPDFQEAIWINDAGDESLLIANHKIDPSESPINLYERLYFRNAVLSDKNNDKLWMAPGQKQKKFALQSIRSWRNGANQAGVSIPISSDDTGHVAKTWKPRVLAISTRLASIMNPLLPPGYGFCIVDTLGKVWFHSDTRRNNQEQLFDEVTDSSLLKSAVLGRDSIALSFRYEGKDKRGFVLPVTNIPLTLVVYHDDDFYHMPISLTVGQASIITLLMFVIFGLDLLLLFASTYQTTKLKTQRFFLSWLRPKEDGDTQIMDEVPLNMPSINYRRSILFLFLLIIFVTVGSVLTNSRWLGLCLLTLPVFVLVFHFLLYRREYLLFNMSQNQRSSWRKHVLLHPFSVLSALLILVVDCYGIQFIEDGTIILVPIVHLSWILIGWLCFKRVNKDTLLYLIRFNFPHSYIISISLWLLLISFLLPVYFYKNAYYKENTIWTRYILLAAARNYFHRDALLTTKTPGDKFGDFLNGDNVISATSACAGMKPDKNEPYDELLFKADPLFGSIMDEAREAIIPSPSDRQWFWSSTPDTISLKFLSFPGSNLKLIAATPQMKLRGDYVLLMFILGAIAVFLMILLILFVVKHIFGVGLINELPARLPSIKWKGDGRAFIVGAPYSGKAQLIANEDNVPSESRIDLRKPPYLVRNLSSVVIEHFEYGINSHAVNEQKRALFMEVLQNSQIRDVTVTSTVQPSALFDFYDSQLADTDKEKDKSEYREYKQAIRYWKNALGGFATGYHSLEWSKDDNDALDKIIAARSLPLKIDEGELESKQPSKKAISLYVSWYLKSELRHGHFLPKLEEKIERPEECTYQSKEEMVLQVEDAAQNYYQSLWNSFSNSEKFLLYDLAKDHFVNFRNIDVIRALLQKGVLTMKDSLRIMNRSFSNFILSVVKEDEVIKMDQELRRKGTWHSVQLGIIIVLLGLATFIALAHQGMLSSLNAWATAITSALALVTRFGGIFGGKKE